MSITGYKILNTNMTTRFGNKLEIGKIYIADGVIKFGKNGFHFCKDIENTFRYMDAQKNEVAICTVVGSGKIEEGYDDYNEYYDMYAAQKIEILKRLTRKEIVTIGLNLPQYKAMRFIGGFHLTDKEIELFEQKFVKNKNVLDIINYYQKSKDKIYMKERR